MTELVLDLCSGIGGFTLAGLISGGFQTVAFCEINPYCQQVLNLRFPQIPIISDLKNVSDDSLRHLGIFHVDGITAGLPCPAFSVAGKQLGSKDSRNLFPEFFRIIRDLRPRWAIVENVPGLLSTEQGGFFASVLREFASIGYDAQWSVVSAASVGAVHRRDRLWIIAYSSGEGCGQRQGSKITIIDNPATHSDRWEQEQLHRYHNDSQERTNPASNSRPDGYPSSDRRKQQLSMPQQGRTEFELGNKYESSTLPQSPFCISNDGFSSCLDGYLLRHENLEEWLAAATIPKFLRLSAEEVRSLTPDGIREYQQLWQEYQAIRRQHKEQLKALGNAIVPQCAAVVFDKLKAILRD